MCGCLNKCGDIHLRQNWNVKAWTILSFFVLNAYYFYPPDQHYKSVLKQYDYYVKDIKATDVWQVYKTFKVPVRCPTICVYTA